MSRQFDTIGRYRLLKSIRSGGTGHVFEAIDDTANRKFAIKALNQEASKDPTEISHIRNEFSVAQKLDSPHVIKIYEMGDDDGKPYLVMELFNHPNLKQHLRQGFEALAPMAENFIRFGALGLQNLHEAGWVHCDVKPDNFLVSAVGEVKLIDFSIARQAAGGGLMGGLMASLMKFVPGMSSSRVKGTRSYMAPEQIRGEPLDERVDVYGFGCTIFELLAGKPPFTGVNSNELLGKHLKSAPPSLLVSNDNIRPEFADLVARMMAKKPEDRPPTMAAFLEEMQKTRVFKTRPQPVEVEEGGQSE